MKLLDTGSAIVPFEDPEVTLARLIREESATAIPAEHVVKAEAGSGRWGDATFHNLDNGARASGSVLSAHSLLRAADLDWDPVLVPLRTAEGLSLPSAVGRAVVRSDTRQPIGCVGDRYQIIPHRKLADLADALVRADGKALHYGNAGHKDSGARPFIQLKSEPRKIGRDSSARDIEVYDLLTLLTSHDGSLRMLATYGACVICCNNTYANALSAASAHGVSVRHTASGLAMVDEAIRIAKAARDYAVQFDNTALRLMLDPFADLDMRRLASALIPGDSTRAENDRRKLLDAWVSAPGANPGTAWGASQAVTFYTSHDIGTRGGTDRAFGLATGEGRGADLQGSAWRYLTTAEGRAALATVEMLRC